MAEKASSDKTTQKADTGSEAALRQTPLNTIHRELGARMVPFAGYDMPVQYPTGIVAEHLHTRAAAGLFDISHMGQAYLHDGARRADAALETLVPGDMRSLKPGRMRYSVLLTDHGGIIDDFMTTRPAEGEMQERLFLVVNAARKAVDFSHIEESLAGQAQLERLDSYALLALQGPKAEAVLSRLAPDSRALTYMSARLMDCAGVPVIVSRCGYTGEDGFEISVAGSSAEALFRKLLAEPEVKPIGLGARDTLRLEAGLSLYGHDIDETTTPVEAGLAWTIGKRRRESRNFPGAEKIMTQLESGPPRRRVGLRPDGRAPVREGSTLHCPTEDRRIGVVTSGGYSPTVEAPIAIGYLESALAAEGTEVNAMVRGKARPCRVVALPFVPPRTVRNR